MDNPLLKKANGFDTPAGSPKKHYDGYYPEAVGGGWNPSDGDDLSTQYSEQCGGYFAKDDAPDKVRNFIEDIYRGTQEPPTKPQGKKPQTVKSVAASLKPGESLSKLAFEAFEYDDDYQADKAESELEQVVRDNIWELHQHLRSAMKAKDKQEYARLYAEAAALIEEYPSVREYAQQNMLSLPSPAHIGVDPKVLKEQKRKGITDAVNDYITTPVKDKKIRRVPKYDEDDKVRLHGLGVKGSTKKAWDSARAVGVLKFTSNRYSFSKGASVEVKAALTPTVLQVNQRLARLHVPKNASAHEAAMKTAATVVKANNRNLERVYKVAAEAVGADITDIVYDASTENFMALVKSGDTIVDMYTQHTYKGPYNSGHEFYLSMAKKTAEEMAVEFGYPVEKVKHDPTLLSRDRQLLNQEFTPEDEKFLKGLGANPEGGASEKELGARDKKNFLERQKDFAAKFDSDFLSKARIKASAKPKCPHCGSSKYALMPTDFETAKCDDCGKNWEHGIVDGVNNPSDKKASVKTASTYKVQKKGREWYIVGLPSTDYEGKQYPDSIIFPGMNHSMNTIESTTQGIYEALYDEFQTSESLKAGDIFTTPVGQFICEGVHVLPYDQQAKEGLAAVDAVYKCKTCGCDQGDHRPNASGGYLECKNHPECRNFKSQSEPDDTPLLRPGEGEEADDNF